MTSPITQKHSRVSSSRSTRENSYQHRLNEFFDIISSEHIQDFLICNISTVDYYEYFTFLLKSQI